MERLVLPSTGKIYVDANTVLYTVNQHPVYAAVCAPLWQAAQQGNLEIISSQLTLMETLIIPYRTHDQPQITLRETLWTRPYNTLLPITQDVLREAARLRANITGLKTPDALHAATAVLHGCAMFVTNDHGFKRVPNLPLAIFDEVLAAP